MKKKQKLTSQQKRQNLFAIIGHYSHYFSQKIVFFEKKSKGYFFWIRKAIHPGIQKGEAVQPLLFV